MIQQSPAKIFLADQRGADETAQFQSRLTFNFGTYFNEHKNAFGVIYLLNDDILAGGAEIQLPVKQASCIALIPVAGAINYKNGPGHQRLVVAGQTAIISLKAGDTLAISNPFREEPVNYLQLWISAEKAGRENNDCVFTYNDVNENLNCLVQASPLDGNATEWPFVMRIGKFSGRGETVYSPAFNNSCFFVFVIEGAFETAGRLLHARDGLALWENPAVEMEALSNNAIILLMELPASL